MKTLAIRRSVPLHASWDVIVVGGGPAGCTAAAAAAREGARTLLIEATGALGGMGTQGLVPAWCPFSDKQGHLVYRGLAETVFRASRKGVPHVPAEKLDWVSINPEQLKRVYDDLVTKHGAEVLFHTFVAGVETKKGRIATLLAANKAGLAAYRARVYVDGTGDADLAAWAGAKFHKGDDGTGELQPATHCFILSNVDPNGMENAWRKHGDLKKAVMKPAIASGKYPDICDPHFCHNFIGPATMGFNSGHLWDVDNTDPVSLSRAMMKGRRIAAQFRDALAERLPEAFANAYLAATGTLMGCRETRRIVGDYVLNMDDYLARQSFPDEICRNNYWIDVHTSKKEMRRAASTGSTEHVIHRFEHYGPGESHGIPYRCLTPKGLHNVLVAGRSISCDRPVQGSVRVMPTCLAMGEAAGMAAAMAAAKKSDVRAVDVQRLRARLRAKGAFLP